MIEQYNKSFLLIMNNKDDESDKIVSMLEDDFDVTYTSTVKNLLGIFNETIPDLIILDLQLVDMDGFELLYELKHIDPFFNVPIIVISENSSIEYETRSFELGASDFICRPYNPVVLKSRINSHLASRLITKDLEHIIEEKNIELHSMKMNNLLNNIDEGIISFNENFEIESGYSKKALEFLDSFDLTGKPIDTMLFEDDTKKITVFRKAFNLIKVLDHNEDKDRVEMCLSLLPEKIVLKKRHFKVRYKILDQKKFMVILEDATKTKELENIIQEQLRTQKMIASIAANKEEFLDLKNDFEDFCLHIEEKIDHDNECKVFLRNLHTFKGLFAQKELVHIVQSIHDLEEQIKALKLKDPNFSIKVLNLVKQKNLLTDFNQDIINAANILGDTYFEQKSKQERFKILNKLEKNIRYLIDHDIIIDNKILSNILSDITHLSSSPLYTHFISFPSLVQKTAKKLNKSIHPMKVHGDMNILVPSYLKEFTKTLVHVYRNCVDHGIEDSETRVIFYKDEFGTIQTNFYSQNDTDIVIEISDNGGGIDVNKIVKKAISEHIITQQQVDSMSYEEKLLLIFEDNITTKQSADVISGRGVGLAAVKQELDKLNGKVQITSSSLGTTFKFILPNVDRSFKKDILNIIVNDAVHYFKNTYELSIEKSYVLEELNLMKNFVLIDFVGGFSQTFGMYYEDEAILYEICKKLFGDDCEDNTNELLEELQKEILNTIAGHVITELKRIGFENVNITIPSIHDTSSLHITKNIVKSMVIQTQLGKVVCFLLHKS